MKGKIMGAPMCLETPLAAKQKSMYAVMVYLSVPIPIPTIIDLKDIKYTFSNKRTDSATVSTLLEFVPYWQPTHPDIHPKPAIACRVRQEQKTKLKNLR